MIFWLALLKGVPLDKHEGVLTVDVHDWFNRKVEEAKGSKSEVFDANKRKHMLAAFGFREASGQVKRVVKDLTLSRQVFKGHYKGTGKYALSPWNPEHGCDFAKKKWSDAAAKPVEGWKLSFAREVVKVAVAEKSKRKVADATATPTAKAGATAEERLEDCLESDGVKPISRIITITEDGDSQGEAREELGRLFADATAETPRWVYLKPNGGITVKSESQLEETDYGMHALEADRNNKKNQEGEQKKVGFNFKLSGGVSYEQIARGKRVGEMYDLKPRCTYTNLTVGHYDCIAKITSEAQEGGDEKTWDLTQRGEDLMRKVVTDATQGRKVTKIELKRTWEAAAKLGNGGEENKGGEDTTTNFRARFFGPNMSPKRNTDRGQTHALTATTRAEHWLKPEEKNRCTLDVTATMAKQFDSHERSRIGKMATFKVGERVWQIPTQLFGRDEIYEGFYGKVFKTTQDADGDETKTLVSQALPPAAVLWNVGASFGNISFGPDVEETNMSRGKGKEKVCWCYNGAPW